MLPVLSIMAGNQDAVELMGDASLRLIAQELLTSRKGSVTVDRAHGESVQARMRVLAKRSPQRHGPPPEFRDAAIQMVLQQAEALSVQWAGGIMVVDRAVEARPGKIAIDAADGDRTVKRLHAKGGRLYPAPDNSAYPCLEVSPETGAVSSERGRFSLPGWTLFPVAGGDNL